MISQSTTNLQAQIKNDRILRTLDIDGATTKKNKFNPELHNNSLKTDDIKGAKPKKNIRSIFGEYNYDPVIKNFSREGQQSSSNQQVQVLRNPIFYSNQSANPNPIQNHQQQDGSHNQQQDGSHHHTNQQDNSNPLSQYPKEILNNKIHKIPNAPPSQVKEQLILNNPPIYQTQQFDYDKPIIERSQYYDKKENLAKSVVQDKHQPEKHQEVPSQMQDYKRIQDQRYLLDSKRLRTIVSMDRMKNSSEQKGIQESQQYTGYNPNIVNQQQQQQQQIKPPSSHNYNNALSQKAEMIEKNFISAQQQSQDTQKQSYEQNIPLNQYQKYYQYQHHQQQLEKQMQQQQAQQQQSQQLQDSYNNQQNSQQQYPITPQQQNYKSFSQTPIDYGSQSAVVNKKLPWANHEYNMIGNYIRDRRYGEEQHKVIKLNDPDLMYYQNYSQQKIQEMRKSAKQQKQNKVYETNPIYQKNKDQFYGVDEPKQIALRQSEYDHAQMQGYPNSGKMVYQKAEAEPQKSRGGFGRSNLFEGPLKKVSFYPERNFERNVQPIKIDVKNDQVYQSLKNYGSKAITKLDNIKLK